MTPRRSSRARTTQPSPALLQHTNSSSGSSNSTTRERSTRSNHKNHSPQGSAGARSQSIDDAENRSRVDLPHTRQRQRARDDDDDEEDPSRPGEDDEIDEDEEEEITRCLCGQQDYPGLPPSRREALLLGRTGVKPEGEQPPADSSDLLSDEIGSMFIQCDSCKVWQHGGCVGIMDEDTSPDQYFCEECRKDLHTIRGEPNGQRSSTYLPVNPKSSPAPSSRASSQDTSSRRSKDAKSRNSEHDANVKRRSTMNSRDAAYDEEELIRRAIQESKEDTKSLPDETATRRGKRSRSDSGTNRQGSKRPRTGSPSPTAVSKQSNPASHPPSEDESKAKPATNGTRRQRAASRGQRDKEPTKEPTKEPEEPEVEAPEAANDRKEKSSRRKGDESEHEMRSPVKTIPPEPEPVQASPNTPTPQEPTPVRPSTRKSGRPPARRGRVGRNQYTKDRDSNGNGTESPRRGQSHDIGGDSPRVGSNNTNGTHVNGGESGRPSKPRHMHPQRTTMSDMKRRVAGILEFISRMQVEMAAASENSSTPTGNEDRSQGLLLKSMVDQIDAAMASATSDGGDSAPPTTDGEGDAPIHEKDFKDLSCFEMMDVLTRHLLKWQQEFGKFGER